MLHKGNAVPVHTTKAYGEIKYIAPLIHNLADVHSENPANSVGHCGSYAEFRNSSLCGKYTKHCGPTLSGSIT
jgi:hypothetical protein